MRTARRHTQRDSRRGFTLTELLTASSVAIIISGTSLMLLIESAREDRRGLADASVEAAVGDLQNRVIGYLRAMSATEGVIFSNPAADEDGNFVGFQRIIVARGPAPDYPREELRFDSDTREAVYDPNRKVANDEQPLVNTGARFALRLLSFSPSLKSDGTPDNSLINVFIRADDDGSSGRPASTLGHNPASVWRSFSVRMRNT